MAEGPSGPLLALEKLRTQLTCPVCLDQYDNPKTLPCLHSFCLKCIQQVVSEGASNCPVCRKKFQDVANLPSFFVINMLLDIRQTLEKIAQNRNITCEKCKKGEAGNYCKQCPSWLCDKCVYPHAEWPEFSDHEIVSAQDVAHTPSLLLSANRSQQPLACPTHSKTLDLYCIVCKAMICRDCQYGSHQHSNCRLVDDVFPDHAREIESHLAITKEKALATTDCIRTIIEREKEISDHGKAVKNEISSYIQELIEFLLVSLEEKYERIDALVEQKLQLLAQQKKEAEIALEQLQSCAEYVEQCLQHGSHQQVLMEKAKMVDCMKQMNEQTDTSEFEPQEKPDFMFLKNNGLSKETSTIGCVSLAGHCTLGVDFTVPPMADREAIAIVHLKNIPDNKRVYPYEAPPTPVCRVASAETKHTVVCDVEKFGDQVLARFTPGFYGDHCITVASDIAVPEFSMCFHVMPSPATKDSIVKTIADLSKPVGVAINKDGLIAVVEGGAHCVTLIDRAGKRTSFGSKGTGDGQLNNPRGIAFTCDGHILVTDDHRLQKFTSSGQHLKSFGSKKKGNGPQQFNTPMGIAVHPTTGDIYIADCYNHRIQVVSDDLSQLRSFGAKGSSASQLKYPTDLSFSLGGVLYINDSGNCRVQAQDVRCDNQLSYTCCSELKDPKSIVVDPCNNIYVVETQKHYYGSGNLAYVNISCYTAEGQRIARFDKARYLSMFAGSYCGVAMDALGNLYISDTDHDKVVIM